MSTFKNPEEVASSTPQNPWKLAFVALAITFALSLTFCFRNMNQSKVLPLPTPAVTTTTQPSVSIPTSAPTFPESYSTYSDERVQGLEFAYDPSQWELSQVKKIEANGEKKIELVNSGILLRNKQSGGKLHMDFVVPYAMGGWTILVTKDTLTQVSEKLLRVKEKPNSYRYGETNVLTLFEKSPKEYEFFATYCNKPEGQPVLDEEGCRQIISHEAIGSISGYALLHNITFKPKIKLTDIDSGYSYIADTGVAEASVSITYVGNNPLEADEIVKQIVK